VAGHAASAAHLDGEFPAFLTGARGAILTSLFMTVVVVCASLFQHAETVCDSLFDVAACVVIGRFRFCFLDITCFYGL
jgi:hypothetical protein